MKLYGTSLSPFVRKVLVVLAEKGVEVQHVPLRFHDPDPRFQAASPLGKIPALDDDGFLLADSSAIIHYLERKHRSRRCCRRRRGISAGRSGSTNSATPSFSRS